MYRRCNRFIVKYYNKFLAEETARQNIDVQGSNVNLRNGWIYKSAEEMAGELLSIASEKTIQRRMKELVEKGFLSARNNPENNWDNTLQYRVDIVKLQKELQALGYALEGYPLISADQSIGQNDQSESNGIIGNGLAVQDGKNDLSREQYAQSKGQNVSSKGHIDESRSQTDLSKGQNVQSSGQNVSWKGHSDQAIPEITTEITKINIECMYGNAARADFEIKNDSERDKSALNQPYQNSSNDFEQKLLDTLYLECENLELSPGLNALGFLDEFYNMLTKCFQGMIELEIITLAFQIFKDKRVDIRTGKVLRIDNPTGWLHDAYKDAIKQYKAIRYVEDRKEREAILKEMANPSNYYFSNHRKKA